LASLAELCGDMFVELFVKMTAKGGRHVLYSIL